MSLEIISFQVQILDDVEIDTITFLYQQTFIQSSCCQKSGF